MAAISVRLTQFGQVEGSVVDGIARFLGVPMPSFVPLMRVAVPRAWKTRRTPEERRDILACHRALARAIADGDPDEARRQMAAHFDESIGMQLRD